MTSQCPMDLDILSSVAGQPLINGSNLNIQIIYKSALLSSAHFRYMAEDWTAGQSCLTTEQDEEMRQAFERWVYFDFLASLWLDSGWLHCGFFLKIVFRNAYKPNFAVRMTL